MDRMGIEISLLISFVLWNGLGLEIRGRLGQSLGSPGGSDSKESACNVGDLGSIPGLERSPGEGNGYPLQYSCLENSVDRGAWRATVQRFAKSQTRLSDFDWAVIGLLNSLYCCEILSF